MYNENKGLTVMYEILVVYKNTTGIKNTKTYKRIQMYLILIIVHDLISGISIDL